MGGRRDWTAICDVAAELVNASSYPLTLRALHYQLLVAAAHLGYVNDLSSYKSLSAVTAQARRDGWFPSLAEDARSFDGWTGYSSPSDALRSLAHYYRRDRTEEQKYAVVLAIEKRTLVPLLSSAFAELGVPIVPLGGYSSQTLCDTVSEEVSSQDRDPVLVIASDFDPSGEDIVRDFTLRTADADWVHVARVALTWEQVEQFDLPPMPGKSKDTRAAGFAARHGGLVQVELDALPPEELVALFRAELERWWDADAHRAVLALEATERDTLNRLADGWDEMISGEAEQ